MWSECWAPNQHPYRHKRRLPRTAPDSATTDSAVVVPGSRLLATIQRPRICFLRSCCEVWQRVKAAPLQSAVNLRSSASGAVFSYSPGVLSSPEFYASEPVDGENAGGAPSLFPLCAGFWRQFLVAPIIRSSAGPRGIGSGVVSENH